MLFSRIWMGVTVALVAASDVAGAFLFADTADVDLTQASVVVAPGSAAPLRLAASELLEHVALATGAVIPVVSPSQPGGDGYRLHVGVVPSGGRLPNGAGRPGYVVAETAAFFFGSGDSAGAGTPAAVHEFLRRECGVRWLAPGAAGTVFTKDLRNLRLRLRRISCSDVTVGAALAFAPEADPAFVAALANFQAHQPAHVVAQARLQWTDWLQRNGLRPSRSASPDGIFAAWVTGLPVGQDIRAPDPLDAHQVPNSGAVKIECPLGGWGLSTFAAYALVNRQRDRDAQLDDLADDYYAAYGPAAADVREYHDFWRRLHVERVAPLLGSPVPGPRFTAEFLHRLHEFWFLEDFRASSVFLHDGLLRRASRQQRERLEMLLLAHEHAEMTFQTITALNRAGGSPARAQQAVEQAGRLHRFREAFASRFGPWTPVLSARELVAGDAAGYDLGRAVGDAQVHAALPDSWHVKPDSEGAGKEQKWFAARAGEFTTWPQLALAEVSRPTDATRTPLWLAAEVPFEATDTEGTKTTLCVWAVTVPCTFYVNGQAVGEAMPDTARPTLALRCDITSALNGETPNQLVIVRTVPADGPPPVWRGAWIVQSDSVAPGRGI